MSFQKRKESDGKILPGNTFSKSKACYSLAWEAQWIFFSQIYIQLRCGSVFFSSHKQQVDQKNEEKIMQRVAHKYKALWGLQEGVQNKEEKEG